MNKKISLVLRLTILLVSTAAIFTHQSASAHCQIPCGIYNDHLRVQIMLEDAATISKSVHVINELAGKNDAQSQNQLARWVSNKEKHAQNIIETINNYFLTQRVKPNQKDYTDRLVKHHSVIVSAMKVKQNVDNKFALELKINIEALAPYYPEHKH